MDMQSRKIFSTVIQLLDLISRLDDRAQTEAIF